MADKSSTEVIQETIHTLKRRLEEDDLLDVGKGAADLLGVTPTKLVRALRDMEEDGYRIWYVQLHRTDSNLTTAVKVLTKNNLSFVDVMARRGDIKKVVL